VEAAISASATMPAFFRAAGLRANPPITIPTAEVQAKNGALGLRLPALGRISLPFGPLVLIASDTVCAPLAPVVIVGFEQVAPAGNPLHAKLTPNGNVVAPTGETTRL
jgi:hypothetical protein